MQYPDATFKPLNIGNNFTFKAGYRIFNLSSIITQSFQSPATIPRVILTDTTANAPVANFTRQPNASEPFLTYTVPHYQWKFGSFDYKVG